MTTRAYTPAVLGAVACALLLLAVGIGTGRVDPAVMGVVLLAATVLRLRARDASGTELSAHTRHEQHSGAQTTAVHVEVDVDVPEADMVVVTATMLGYRTSRMVLPPGHTQAMVDLELVHSGTHDVVELSMVSVTGDGLRWSGPSAPAKVTTHWEPQRRALPALPLPAAPHRLTGGHDAPRGGDGGAFRDIHPYTPGDRLRRIDWKATARLGRRPGDLYVRRTLATSDIDVAIVVDDGDDVTGALADWSHGSRRSSLRSSLDLAREAAWSIACAYLDAGDNVAYQVLSRAGNAVARGSGARHRERLRATIAHTVPEVRISRTRVPALPSGALVVLLSTFLDDAVVDTAVLWRAAGHRVLAVDTLPPPVSERLHREQAAAARIVLGMREDRLARLEAAGVDTLSWGSGPGPRAARLRVLSLAGRNR